MSVSIFQRGGRWSVRVSFPEGRWTDIGRAVGAVSGLKRDISRSLETSSRREAEDRKHEAAAAIRAEVDAKLAKAKLRPLTDWTADWMSRAVERREEMRKHGGDVVSQTEDYRGRVEEVLARDFMIDTVEAEQEAVRRRQGDKAAEQFWSVAAGQGMTVAQAAHQWLAEERQKVRAGTIASHDAAFRRLEVSNSVRLGPTISVQNWL